jgi:hypothetical protein
MGQDDRFPLAARVEQVALQLREAGSKGRPGSMSAIPCMQGVGSWSWATCSLRTNVDGGEM